VSKWLLLSSEVDEIEPLERAAKAERAWLGKPKPDEPLTVVKRNATTLSAVSLPARSEETSTALALAEVAGPGLRISGFKVWGLGVRV